MLLFCVKTIMKESWNFELSQEEESKKKHLQFGDFWYGTLAMLFRTTMCVAGDENTQR